MRSYKSRDGLNDCLCFDCFTQYEKEMQNTKDRDAIKESEERTNAKIQYVVKSIKQVGNRLKEHDTKIGNLTKRLEVLEKELKNAKKSS